MAGKVMVNLLVSEVLVTRFCQSSPASMAQMSQIPRKIGIEMPKPEESRVGSRRSMCFPFPWLSGTFPMYRPPSSVGKRLACVADSIL